MTKVKRCIEKVLVTVHMKYDRKEVSKNSIINIKKKFVINKKIKKAAEKAEITARKTHKQLILNSTQKIKMNRMLRTKTKKQIQDDLKEKRKAITENKNESNSDDELNNNDEKTFLSVTSLKSLNTQSSDIFNKY